MIKNGKTYNEKNRITDGHIKRHDSTEKKPKSKTKHSQAPLTSKQCIINREKAAVSFKFKKTQVMSGSQDQKERKTASTVTKTFFGQKMSANLFLQRSLTQ